jgi:hypothetical protein
MFTVLRLYTHTLYNYYRLQYHNYCLYFNVYTAFCSCDISTVLGRGWIPTVSFVRVYLALLPTLLYRCYVDRIPDTIPHGSVPTIPTVHCYTTNLLLSISGETLLCSFGLLYTTAHCYCITMEVTLLDSKHVTIYRHMRYYQKVPGLGQKRYAGLTYSIFAAISFKIVSLGMYTAIPSFFPRFKSTWKSLSFVEYHLQFPLDVRHCFKTPSLQFHFKFGKQSEIIED